MPSPGDLEGPTQDSNPDLLHCRQVLYHLSHRGSPKIYVSLEIKTELWAQWLRICLAMQGTWVQSLVQEDPTCLGASKPARYNY